ncbi:MAG: hypothetical protein HYS55_02870 [Candidatus Omnitrophica bacterium]|nr:hypothetical protein [Candidatus Omnitrophota bacterium]
MNAGLLLIALALGYKIFADASTSAKKSLKRLGRIVGVYIMVVSFVGTVCVLNCVIQYGKSCPLPGKMWGQGGMKMCPITGMPLTTDKSPK